MTVSAPRTAWGLVMLVLTAWAVAAVLGAVGVAPTTGGGAPLVTEGGTGTAGQEGGAEDHVVLLGIPGLTWDVIDEQSTPHLAALAREGGTAALVLRGTHEVTCAADGWLTVGAGQRAATDVEGCRDADFEATPASDRPSPVLVDDVVRDGTVDAGTWERWQEAASRRSLGGELGTLAALAADAGTCVAAYGGEAVLAAAGPDGSAVSAVHAEEGDVAPPTPGESAAGSTTCRLHLVSAPPLAPPHGTPTRTPPPGETVGAVPPVPATEIDGAVGQIRSGLPAGTTLVVAGLGHTAGRAEAMALLVSPAGDGDGAALSSGSTRQRSLVQLTDLTPTLLRLAGVELPSSPTPLAGQPLTVEDGADGAVPRARDLAAGISLAKSATPWVLGVLAVMVLPILVVAGLLRRGRVVTSLVTVGMAVPVATFLAGLVPWWRAGQPVAVLTLVVAGMALLVTLVAQAGPWRRDPLGPPAVVAAVSLAVLGVDMLWSARLGLVSVLGLQPVTAGRFYGQGNVGFGIALGSFLVLAAAVLTWLRPTAATSGDGETEHADPGSRDGDTEHTDPGSRDDGTERADQTPGRSPRAAVAVSLLGGGLAVLGAAPWGGADFGGVPAVVVATGLLAMTALGLRWSAARLVALGLLGLAAAAAVMVLDFLRGPNSRTHLGDFVQRVIDGEALEVVGRKLDQSLGILLTYPLSWLAVLALVLVASVVLQQPRWSAPLWRPSGLRPAWVAGLLAVVLAWALNDSGIAVVALALTMMIAASLAVLGRELTRG